jgi:hypothetical protein
MGKPQSGSKPVAKIPEIKSTNNANIPKEKDASTIEVKLDFGSWFQESYLKEKSEENEIKRTYNNYETERLWNRAEAIFTNQVNKLESKNKKPSK